MRPLSILVISAARSGVLAGALVGVMGLLAACEQQQPLVFVLESPQELTLTASASALRVPQGDSIELRVQRRTSGKWRQVRLDEVRPGQCWVYRPPPESEAEVADSVHWKVVPENAVRFTAEVRMDNVRKARMIGKGTITLIPRSAVTCEPDRVVEGPSIQIEVT
jgi:hypothetical protein